MICETVKPWRFVSLLVKRNGLEMCGLRFFSLRVQSNILREATGKYAKNHFQRNRYSVFESHVMRKERLSTKILQRFGDSEVVLGRV